MRDAQAAHMPLLPLLLLLAAAAAQARDGFPCAATSAAGPPPPHGLAWVGGAVRPHAGPTTACPPPPPPLAGRLDSLPAAVPGAPWADVTVHVAPAGAAAAWTGAALQVSGPAAPPAVFQVDMLAVRAVVFLGGLGARLPLPPGARVVAAARVLPPGSPEAAETLPPPEDTPEHWVVSYHGVPALSVRVCLAPDVLELPAGVCTAHNGSHLLLLPAGNGSHVLLRFSDAQCLEAPLGPATALLPALQDIYNASSSW